MDCRKAQERFASLAESLDLLSHVPFLFELAPKKSRRMPAANYLKEHLCQEDRLHLEGCLSCTEHLNRVAEMLELGEWYFSYALPPYFS